MKLDLKSLLRKYQQTYHPVIKINHQKQKITKLDFSKDNPRLTVAVMENIDKFSNYINSTIQENGAEFGIGGYDELRTVYSLSKVFDADSPTNEPRRLHIGTDIWGSAGTPVYAFMGGMVHSFAFNDQQGDYGATMVLLHQLDGMDFYTLYGHISLKNIQALNEGQYITRGECIAHFGTAKENGQWPPHLHFQVIQDMELHEGDYPGVCRLSQRERYLANCPDPDLILQLNKFAI